MPEESVDGTEHGELAVSNSVVFLSYTNTALNTAPFVTKEIPIHFAGNVLCGGLTPTQGGFDGDDEINGTAGNDVIVGLDGEDVIDGGEGNDVNCGGPGADVLRGQPGRDKLFGDLGSDVLRGGKGEDTCIGGLGIDRAKKCERVGSL